jgi:hypothetical protein
MVVMVVMVEVTGRHGREPSLNLSGLSVHTDRLAIVKVLARK